MPRSKVKTTERVDLRIIERLMNTRAFAGRDDQLRDIESAAAWLANQGLLATDAKLSEAQRQRLVELRDGLLGLLLTSVSRWDDAALARLNRAAQGAHLEVRFTLDRNLEIESRVLTFDAAFGRVVSLVVGGYFSDLWRRFKVCGECHKVYFDDSKSCARRWCTRQCGDVVRTRKYRRTDWYKRTQ